MKKICVDCGTEFLTFNPKAVRCGPDYLASIAPDSPTDADAIDAIDRIGKSLLDSVLISDAIGQTATKGVSRIDSLLDDLYQPEPPA